MKIDIAGVEVVVLRDLKPGDIFRHIRPVCEENVYLKTKPGFTHTCVRLTDGAPYITDYDTRVIRLDGRVVID